MGAADDRRAGRTPRIRRTGISGQFKLGGEPPASVSSRRGVGDGSDPGAPSQSSGRHVYRVGGFKIPVKNSVRGPKSRCAVRVRELLRKRVEVPTIQHRDPTEFEPPIRKPPSSGVRRGLRDLPVSSSRHPGSERFEPADDDDEDLDD